ncbi:MAG TPA: alkaline phosphatase family protein, partial [Acidimicrobiales bacterium]|nr:alkaline phosphatase family protein [Acidimicrobiales bacterium]
LFPLDDAAVTQLNYQAVDNFFSDCASGSLPAFTLLDPDYSTQSQENPQDVSVGEAFLYDVVKALFASPQWRTTLLVVTYDEHGGYYDHVPPPVALVPDSIPPVVASGESTYDGYARYGFRVPTLVVSPFAIPGGLTHAVYDQTSILAMVESKWNLPAMTYRDANANDLTGFLDMAALQAKQPTFAEVDISSFAGSGSSQPHGPIPPAGSQGPPA